MGNEASGSATGTAFGNGHFQYNNNYILFGKGVKGGAWIGKNDDVTQMGYSVDFDTVETEDPNAVAMAPTPLEFEPEQPGASEADGEGYYSARSLDFQAVKRPFMAKDVVRTILGTAGQDARYNELYTDQEIANAKTIRPVLKG